MAKIRREVVVDSDVWEMLEEAAAESGESPAQFAGELLADSFEDEDEWEEDEEEEDE